MNPLTMLFPGAAPLQIALKPAPWLAIAVLTTALLITRNTLHEARLADKTAEMTRRAEVAERGAAWAAQQITAIQDFADRQAMRGAIITNAREDNRLYAKTSAGSAACLAADRVRGIDAFYSALATSPAKPGTGAVPHADRAAPE